MISGSIALNIYSIPRMTRDIDIVIELKEERIDEFTSLFPNSYFDKEVIKEEIKRKGIFNIIDHQTGFKIDFIIKKESEYFNLAFQRRQRIKEIDIELWVIRPEDLVIAKLIWIQQYQSDTQLSDIENLLLIPAIDMNYLKTWYNTLKLKTFNLFEHE
jgi:hypothetical protein